MARKSTPGVCRYCNAQFAKSAITRHVQACEARREQLEAQKPGKQAKSGPILQIMVQGADRPEYWMLIEISAKAPLYVLDDFLRDVWLECCGHLSVFTIGGEQYFADSESADELDGQSMDAKIGDLVSEDNWFEHEYDFGTTTELALHVVGQRQGILKTTEVLKLATNVPPDIRCACGEPATQVCAQCQDAGAWLCDRCAANHECGEEMLLPVVNSPRVGMCAYSG